MELKKDGTNGHQKLLSFKDLKVFHRYTLRYILRYAIIQEVEIISLQIDMKYTPFQMLIQGLLIAGGLYGILVIMCHLLVNYL